MSEHMTHDLGYSILPRMNEIVTLDNSLDYVDILLPSRIHARGMAQTAIGNVMKTLRLTFNEQRSQLTLNDLSEYVRTDHLQAVEDHNHVLLPKGVEDTAGNPFDVMDLYDGARETFGRDFNPNGLPILDSIVVSRRHFVIATNIGKNGLTLSLQDVGSTNGSKAEVRHVTNETTTEEPMVARFAS